ncbi:hypothetical protein AMAG_19907 [Allomyces macrogynus ATCC 38327]|uniref:F-box domain-containing protein n=1 Tax=Allomyces macrogynus (strain ATCC 38327) TaxID=578462 RepID=A0A0L0T3K4_ALLM3|nr:hypothetical protein AMAG_19907 [Allomyces macrogynus ATCC 38327]|eukprot:KNE69317.1 hypothetical protein AMAG_19907 [Allomyces macrogynus ATCC 38327]
MTHLASGSGSSSRPARGSAGRHASVRAVSHPSLFRHDSGVADVVSNKWAVGHQSASPLGAPDQARRGNGTAATLPHDVCLAILRHLGIVDRLVASRVCRAWRTAAVCPSLWAAISFTHAVAHRVPLGAVLRLMAWGSASLVHLDLRGCSNIASIEPILAAAAMFAPNLGHLDLRGLAPLPRRPFAFRPPTNAGTNIMSYLMVQHVVAVAPGLRVRSSWATRHGEVVPSGPIVDAGEERRQVTIEDVVLGSAPLCPIV